MLEQGIPLEAIITELVLSGEVERTMRLVRESGLRGAVRVPLADEPVRPALAARRRTTTSTSAPTMRELVDDIASGRFADEWDAERDAGYPELEEPPGAARRGRGPRVRGGPAPEARGRSVPSSARVRSGSSALPATAWLAIDNDC